MSRTSLSEILERCTGHHAHLCPRQILGARMGLAGLAALGFEQPPPGKRLLIILETDGCFLDGLSAATDCTPGHRTLRIEDLGKTAAVFVDSATARAVRVAPVPDIRARAGLHAPAEPRRYLAQMQAYRSMPAEELFTFTPVRLHTPIAVLLSRPGTRACCASCGEEVMNERTVRRDGAEICLACAHGRYYTETGPGGFAGQPGFPPPWGRMEASPGAAMDQDQAEIQGLIRTFFSVFDNRGGARPKLELLRELFVGDGLIIKNSGPAPEVFNLDQFILPRERMLNDGTLTEFSEEEITGRTDLCGNIGQRISLYRKSGILAGQPFRARGVKTSQLIRTAAGWKLSAVAWDDERDGFTVPEHL